MFARTSIIQKPLWRIAGMIAWGIVGECAACAATPPSQADLLWLARITYGIDRSSLERLQQLGRTAFLDQQLAATDEALPAAVAARIDALPLAHDTLGTVLAELTRRRRELAQEGGAAKSIAQRELRREGVEQARATITRELLRAVYSPAQLKEQLVWFWLDQFNVFVRKGPEPWLLADYVDRAIRPHALGHYRELVLATLLHPAMLVYLDNARNAIDHRNENYARELLELQTLGVDAGYTQTDVQELARVLTGVGLALPRPNGRRAAPIVSDGAFAFQPARHDYGDKRLLGHTIRGRGFAEIEQAVDLLVRQDACARFVARRLAQYFVVADPPASLVEAMARTFRQTDGDLRAVLRTMFASPEFAASLGRRFKDPMHFVVATLRLQADSGKPIDTDAALRWLSELGELPFERQTPDGYPLDDRSWSSSGQLASRFAVAREIAATLEPTALLASCYAHALDPYWSPTTRQALAAAISPRERAMLFLASPEFNQR
jgi:uncharacterized protein (DUF1800 family)